MYTWRLTTSNLCMPSQQSKPDTAHQHLSDAQLPKTRHWTMNNFPSILTTWQSWKMGCAGRFRKADMTSDLKVTKHFLRLAFCTLCRVWPKVCISSYLTFASAQEIPSLIPEWEWSVMTHGFLFCQTMNMGEIFAPRGRLVSSKLSDHLPAMVSLSWKVQMASRSSGSVT